MLRNDLTILLNIYQSGRTEWQRDVARVLNDSADFAKGLGDALGEISRDEAIDALKRKVDEAIDGLR